MSTNEERRAALLAKMTPSERFVCERKLGEQLRGADGRMGWICMIDRDALTIAIAYPGEDAAAIASDKSRHRPAKEFFS